METETAISTKTLEVQTKENLVNQAARSVKWSILYNTAPRVVTPFSTMILAAILTPSDFGLVAISTFIIALAKIVVDLGLGKAVIQRQTHVQESASISLWTSILISTILYATIWLAAPWLSVAYSNAMVKEVIRISAFSLPLYAFITIPKAIMRREMQFQRLFWVDSSLLIIQAIASVILALFGLGAWSLIWGQLFGLCVCTLIAWSLARWRPMFVLNWALLQSMLGFSIWIIVTGFQNWLFIYADHAIAGLFLNTQGLGMFSLGISIATLIPTFLMASLSDVAYPVFCKLQANHREIGQHLLSVQALSSAILFPVAFGIAAVSSPAIELLYHDKWLGLGALISILAIVPGLVPLWSLNENAYQAIGRPDISTKLAGFSLLILLPLLWAAAPHGLMPFAIARFVGGIFLPLGNLLVGARILGIRIIDQLKAYAAPLGFSLIMYGVVTLLIAQLGPYSGIWGWVKLLSTILVGAVVYAALTWFLNRELGKRIVVSIRQMLA